MAFQKIFISVSILLLLANPGFSSNKEYISKEQYRQTLFNHSILNMARDASVFLHSLKVLRQENAGAEVVNFMEYQLDEIVCATEKFESKMNPTQKKITKNFLYEIKEYRAKYPRQKHVEIDPTKFSKYFEPFNKTYADHADKNIGCSELKAT